MNAGQSGSCGVEVTEVCAIGLDFSFLGILFDSHTGVAECVSGQQNVFPQVRFLASLRGVRYGRKEPLDVEISWQFLALPSGAKRKGLSGRFATSQTILFCSYLPAFYQGFIEWHTWVAETTKQIICHVSHASFHATCQSPNPGARQPDDVSHNSVRHIFEFSRQRDLYTSHRPASPSRDPSKPSS